MRPLYLTILIACSLWAKSQGTIIDGGGNIVGIAKLSDTSGAFQTKWKCDTARLNLYTLLAAHLASINLKVNISDTATQMSGYLRKTGSAANLTGFPTLNQNTTGTAGGLSANIAESQVTNLTTDLGLKANAASPTFTGSITFPANQIGVPVWGRVTGSNATTTGQALTNITGLSVALIANATYEFEADISASTTAVTTGIQYGVQYSAAGASVEGQINGSLTSTASKSERISALNTATSAFLTTSAQSGAITITGTLVTGANAGNLTIQHLKVTSGTSTVFINSRLRVIRIL